MKPMLVMLVTDRGVAAMMATKKFHQSHFFTANLENAILDRLTRAVNLGPRVTPLSAVDDLILGRLVCSKFKYYYLTLTLVNLG